MDLQTRKINFIQDFLKVDNEKIITLLEKLLKKETEISTEFKAMTINEFHSRIAKSSQDASNGKITSLDNLISEIDKWS